MKMSKLPWFLWFSAHSLLRLPPSQSPHLATLKTPGLCLHPSWGLETLHFSAQHAGCSPSGSPWAASSQRAGILRVLCFTRCSASAQVRPRWHPGLSCPLDAGTSTSPTLPRPLLWAPDTKLKMTSQRQPRPLTPHTSGSLRGPWTPRTEPPPIQTETQSPPGLPASLGPLLVADDKPPWILPLHSLVTYLSPPPRSPPLSRPPASLPYKLPATLSAPDTTPLPHSLPLLHSS